MRANLRKKPRFFRKLKNEYVEGSAKKKKKTPSFAANYSTYHKPGLVDVL